MAAKQAEKAAEDSGKKTCFVMMPISDVEAYPVGHFAEVYKQLIEPAVNAAGYECSLATSTSAAHMIQLEVVTKVATADLCICDLSTNNPNVLFEYGIRQAFDLPTVLIKDDKTRRIFDLNGFRDIEYDHNLRIANTLAARASITKAIEDTVGGAGDAEQVFSLVQLMKLTKASLPSGELNKDDARFELLELKMDRVLEMFSTVVGQNEMSRRRNLIDASAQTATFRHQPYKVVVGKESVEVGDSRNQTVTVYRDLAALQRSPFYNSLSGRALKEFDDLILKFSDLLPF